MNMLLQYLSENKLCSSVGLFLHIQKYFNSSRLIRNRSVSTNKIFRTINKLSRTIEGSLEILVLGKITTGYSLKNFQNFIEASNHRIVYVNSSVEALEALQRAEIKTINLNYIELLPQFQIRPHQILQ